MVAHIDGIRRTHRGIYKQCMTLFRLGMALPFCVVFDLMQAVGSNGPRLSTWPQLSELLSAYLIFSCRQNLLGVSHLVWRVRDVRGMYVVCWGISLAKGLNMRAALFGFKFLLGGVKLTVLLLSHSLYHAFVLIVCLSLTGWFGEVPH